MLALFATAVALSFAAVALASPQFKASFRMTYLTQKPGAPTGQVPLMTWSDPGAPNGVPKVIRRITMKFHRGTRFDTSALARCRASDATILSKGASACPASSRLGAGHTDAALTAGTRFTTDVTLFNARGQIIVLVTVGGTPVTEFRDRVEGRTITIEPVLPAGVSLERLKLRIGPHSTGRGAKRRTYMRAPPTCPKSRRWTTVARFVYADGSTETLRSHTPCRRPA